MSEPERSGDIVWSEDIMRKGSPEYWELANKYRSRKRRGTCLIFTNGVFDLFHSGHAMLFREIEEMTNNLARQGNDVEVVVGLNSDVSVRALKGHGRPIISEMHRAEVLRALRVDPVVIIFDEETPADLIEYICPDFVVKGRGYEKGSIVALPGTAHIASAHVSGMSTTELICELDGHD